MQVELESLKSLCEKVESEGEGFRQQCKALGHENMMLEDKVKNLQKRLQKTAGTAFGCAQIRMGRIAPRGLSIRLFTETLVWSVSSMFPPHSTEFSRAKARRTHEPEGTTKALVSGSCRRAEQKDSRQGQESRTLVSDCVNNSCQRLYATQPYATVRYAMLCCAMFCYAATYPTYATLCYAVLCNATLRYAMLWYLLCYTATLC